MIFRILGLIVCVEIFDYIRRTIDVCFDWGWTNGWDEGFACGISATPEQIEEVYPADEE